MDGGRRLLRLVDVGIELSWDHVGLAALAAEVYPEAPTASTAQLRFHLQRTSEGDRLVAEGDPAPPRRSLGELFTDTEFAITEATLRHLRRRYLLLHAASVARQGRAILAVGAHDAGKTSLAVALCRRAGATPLSDDVAPIHPGALTVAPFPRDFILHAGTLAALPVVSPSPGFKCSTGYRYLPPGAVCGPCASPGAPAVCGVLFPHRQAGARTAISAVGEAEAARRLLAQCFDLEGLGEGAVEAIARLARLPAADLTFDDASGTAEAVNEWWRQAASEVEG